MLSALEVARHNSRESCWIIIAGFAYDVTEFLGEHPGGAAIILKYAGQDATEVYESLHPPSALADNLPPEKKLGPVEPGTVSLKTDTPPVQVTNVKLPPLTQMISLLDFEVRDLLFISSSSNYMVIQGRGTRNSLC
jgi:L-lactate dehydrogenase (cytochrome)